MRFIEKTMKRYGKAEAIVTDGSKSYQAAMKDLGIDDHREMGRWLNNNQLFWLWMVADMCGYSE